MINRVIVTRPSQDAQVWVAKLQQSGFTAQALPLIEIATVSNPAELKALEHACSRLSDYTACMFVSSNAVEHFFVPFQVSKVALDQSIRAQAATNNIAINIPPPTLEQHAVTSAYGQD